MGVIRGRGFRPGNLVIAVVAVCASWLLTGCIGGASTPLCDAAKSLADHGHLARAAAAYAAARHGGEGDCATDGLSTLADTQRQTFLDLAEAQAAEARGDRTAAHEQYGSVVAADVDDTVAAVGLTRTSAAPGATSALGASAPSAGAKASAAGSAAGAAGASGAGGKATGDAGIGAPMLGACALTVVAAFTLIRSRLRRWRARSGPRRPGLRKRLRPRRRPVSAASVFLPSSPAGSDGGFDTAETLQRLLDSSLRQQASLHQQRATLEQQRTDLHQQRELLLRLLGERVTIVRFRREHRDLLATAPDASVVEARVVWVPTDDGGHGRLLMMRCTPPRTDAAPLAAAYGASGERDEADGSSLRALEQALYDAVARQPVDVSARGVELWWVGAALMSFLQAADVLAGPDGLHVKAHELLVGDPIETMVRAADAPFPLPTLIAPMMAETDVPSEVGVGSARTLLEVTGLVIETADGQPVVVSACTRSLAYDLMLSMVEGSVPVRAVPVPRPPDDGERREPAARQRHAEPEVPDKGRAAGQRAASARAARLANASARADAVLEVVFGTGNPVVPDQASDGTA